jgi:hypothetical protein
VASWDLREILIVGCYYIVILGDSPRVAAGLKEFFDKL